MRSVSVRAAIAALALVSTTTVAAAHVSISSGAATANATQKISFGVGHGCEGADTIKIRVVIPAGVSSVRALRSDFGNPTVERDAAEAITAVVWEKPLEELKDADYGYYELTIRARVGDVPFTTIPFAVYQTCRTPEGVETTVAWDGVSEDAAELVVVPARLPGWNQYTLDAPIAEADVGRYFGDAMIVWRDNAAYSPNPAIAALIAMTTGVTPLTGDLAAGDELWVRY